jgi:lysophospholipase L1-like esterase
MRWYAFMKDLSISRSMVWLGFAMLAVTQTAVASVHLVLAGDSTVADFPKPPRDRPELAGWGQSLPVFLLKDVKVTNLAKSGTSSKSFRELGLWDQVLAAKPDWVLIQFGHNDQPNKGERATDAATDYRANLKRFIEEVRGIGAKPVLVTSVARRTFEGGKLATNLTPYVEAMKAVGEEMAVPVIDLHHCSFALFSQRGEAFCRKHYAPSETDLSHFNAAGARLMARLVAEGLEREVPELREVLQLLPPVPAGLPFELARQTVTSGYDGVTCWVHPRAGSIPRQPNPSVVMTMQKLLLTGSDVFYALNEVRTDDLGQTWGPITEHGATLGRRQEAGGVIVGACDFTPKWHAASGKLLGIGHTVRYLDDKVIHNRKRETSYAVYDDKERAWSAWTTLAMPDEPKFHSAGAGSVQRVDLENGEILLPIYFKGQEDKFYRVTVLRCAFDGKELKYLGHGTELALESGRGVYEPSLIRFGGRFYLTLRNDTAGYVSVSEDGQNFGPIQPWAFDDGAELGNYNTQQHWVAGPDSLWLVYTRSGAHNDHVFRHRAPLFIGKVDPQRLRVQRATETVLVPERGARLGNFAVCEVSKDETWVTVSEWMQTLSPHVVIPTDNPFGADNRVYVAKLKWKKP